MDWNDKTELVKKFVERTLFGWDCKTMEEYCYEVLSNDYMKLSEEDLFTQIEYNFPELLED